MPSFDLKLLLEEASVLRKTAQSNSRKRATRPGASKPAPSSPSIDGELRSSVFTPSADITEPEDESIEYLVGEAAAQLEGHEGWMVSWPIRHGYLNITKEQSIALQRENLRCIWDWCFQNVLGISPGTDRFERGVVLLVPDQFQRRDIILMTAVLLDELGFGRILLQQESVTASFAMGISCVCLVDLGHTKVSVTCIEDGLSLRNSRICMNWGGEQVDQITADLLDIPVKWARLVKETTGHLDCTDGSGGQGGSNGRSRGGNGSGNSDGHSGSATTRVLRLPAAAGGTVRVKPDAQLAIPLSMFHAAELFTEHVDPYLGPEPHYHDPNDALGQDYLQGIKMAQFSQPTWQTALNKRKGKRKKSKADLSSEFNMSSAGDGDAAETAGDGDVPLTRKNYRQVFSLERAVIECIGRVGKTELIKRLLSHIAVIGGGSLVPGLHAMLEQRVSNALPRHSTVERVDVIHSKSQRAVPELLSWRGGAIVASLESSESLWIEAENWKKEGSVALRKSISFSWRPHSLHIPSNRLESDPTFMEQPSSGSSRHDPDSPKRGGLGRRGGRRSKGARSSAL